MNKKMLPLLLSLSLLLSGCGWMDGEYVHISAHQDQGAPVQEQILTASNYSELEQVLIRMVKNGTDSGVIFLSEYDQGAAERAMSVISRRMVISDPVSAYAVDHINYEVGANSGKPAIAVEFVFRHSPMEIHQIHRVKDIPEAEALLGHSLEIVKAGLVMLIEDYESCDFIQTAADYALSHPQTVMEMPHVTEAVYGTGHSRVVELSFTYQTSRDTLKSMSSQIQPIFEAAKLYVSKDSPELQQFAQLYSFLMERFDYRIQSSITPSYSLLYHGVGDSKAFATVYSAMCRSVGLDCKIINGTRDGEPWTWNLIGLDGFFHHVDLLQNAAGAGFHPLTPEEMAGYVWDYSSAPAVLISEIPDVPEETADEAYLDEAPGENKN